MSSHADNLPDFFAGMRLDHADPQSIVNALRQLQRYVGNINQFGPRVVQDFQGLEVTVETFLARTHSEGCSSNNDPKFIDARYYCKRVVADTGMETEVSKADLLIANPEKVEEWKLCFVATNIGELPPNNTGTGTHLLEDGKIVQVHSMYLQTDENQKFYWFDHAPPLTVKSIDAHVCNVTKTYFFHTPETDGIPHEVQWILSEISDPSECSPPGIDNKTARIEGKVYVRGPTITWNPPPNDPPPPWNPPPPIPQTEPPFTWPFIHFTILDPLIIGGDPTDPTGLTLSVNTTTISVVTDVTCDGAGNLTVTKATVKVLA